MYFPGRKVSPGGTNYSLLPLVFATLIANPPARSAHPLTSDLAQSPFNTFTTLEELFFRGGLGEGEADVVMT